MGAAERNLIVAACFSGKDGDGVDGQVVNSVSSLWSEEKRRIPQAFFIFNKGVVKFSLQKANNDDTPRKTLHLRIDDIIVDGQEGLFTCMRRPDPASPWWVVSPEEIDSIESNSDKDSLEDSLTYSGNVWKNNSFRFQLDHCADNDFYTTYGSYGFGRFMWNERDQGVLNGATGS